MHRRKFLQSATILGGGVISAPWISCGSHQQTQPAEQLKNWAENLQFSTTNVYYPNNNDEVITLVKKYDKIKALGSRHSFNTIADSDQHLLSSKNLNKVVSLDKQANKVTVEAGITYGDLAPYLHQNGYALHNLASLPHITVGGACATATHGSGINNGNLSTAVSAIEIVNAKGEIIILSKSKDPDKFFGAVVGLGALGIVTKLTLDLLPTFNMKQVVYQNLAIKELEKNFKDIMSMGYSVSFFTDWSNKNINEVWVKKLIDTSATPSNIFGAAAATKTLHPVETQSAESVTDQLDSAGVWYERMPHFKMGFKPSTGRELQSEFFVSIEQAYDAIAAMESIHEKITPHLFISEIRTVKADEFWMSPCYKKDCVAIHTTWKQDPEVISELIPLVEEKLSPFKPRPHWAKLFTIPPATLQASIEKLGDFKRLCAEFDPEGKFRNAFLEKNLYS